MKTFLILALLAIAATNANAIFEWRQQPYVQQPFFQPFPQQQLNPCKVFLQQQCNPMTLTMMVPFLRSQTLQQSSCHVMQQQCCQQLVQIPQQSRCPAVCGLVHSIFIQQQQQFGQGTFFQPKQQLLGQEFFQPQQIDQFEATRAMTMQTLQAMCNVYVPPYCCTTTAGTTVGTTAAPFGGVATCAGGMC